MAKKKAIMKKVAAKKATTKHEQDTHATGRPSALVDTRVVYCGDNLEQLANCTMGVWI